MSGSCRNLKEKSPPSVDLKIDCTFNCLETSWHLCLKSWSEFSVFFVVVPSKCPVLCFWERTASVLLIEEWDGWMHLEHLIKGPAVAAADKPKDVKIRRFSEV